MTPDEVELIDRAKAILKKYLSTNPLISSWQALMDYCQLTVRGDVERFHVLYLDRKNRLIEDVVHGIGTVDHTPVYPREILRKALELNASALILVHNHPSQDPAPSDSDISMTKQIIKAARTLSITVHDHVITGREPMSFRAAGII